ncbi:ATP-binding protein [Microbacterium sp. NPDC077184]|uniref:sensor histidine kinase n=1 Tax=Microbacterium sp. NPDC077184 TaxID=3154764 RepID=UPI00343E6075
MTDRAFARGSAASRVFAIVMIAVIAVAGLTVGALLWEAQRAARSEAERVTAAIAYTLSVNPMVVGAVADDDPARATETLQPVAVGVVESTPADFVTVMDVGGIRITHRDPTQIGRPYIGTIPTSDSPLTEEFAGTLGPSVRTIAPIRTSGDIVGWVAVGVTVGSIGEAVLPRVLVAGGIAAGLVAAGLGGAALARRATRRVAGDLPARAVRDTLAAAASMRTLGEALRAQTHEHGNRMHTAVALLELGRTEEAVSLLTASARQSQMLVDDVAARIDGDPTVGALLLGKASQAQERGIRWTAEIAPDAPRSLLTPVDQVALVGNLVDNALDAAAAGPEPRWVSLTMARTSEDELLLTVADSGTGVSPHLRQRIFERGFSTKPAGETGRGFGLALVRAVVDDVGGSLVLAEGAPTTFRVVLPTEAPR